MCSCICAFSCIFVFAIMKTETLFFKSLIKVAKMNNSWFDLRIPFEIKEILNCIYLCKRNDDFSKNTLLMNAANHNVLEIVSFLIDNGADVHANRDAPLCWAAKNGYTEIVKMLISAGADIIFTTV